MEKKINKKFMVFWTSCLGGPCILWLFPFSAIILAHCKLRVHWKAEQANIYHFFKMPTQRNASRSPLDAFFEDRWVISSWRPGSNSQRSQLQHSQSNSRPCFSDEVCWEVAQFPEGTPAGGARETAATWHNHLNWGASTLTLELCFSFSPLWKG